MRKVDIVRGVGMVYEIVDETVDDATTAWKRKNKRATRGERPNM